MMSSEKNINKLTVLDAITGLREGKFTALELTVACLKRIEEVDSKVNAFVTVTGDLAREQAKKADKLIKELGKTAWAQYPLLGIPFACKDNYSSDGILTTASSNILKNYIPPYNATALEKLFNAGAILVGKTNMDAFAHGSSTETSDFFKTKNPWNLDKSPGGSSGGSAAAVASDMCVFATGSETAGSIRGPAAWTGVVGLKPTYGRVSRYGIVAMASSTDSPGPITKNVSDSAYVLRIMAGHDAKDATSSDLPVTDYLSMMNDFKLKGVKIGRPKSYMEIDLEKGVKDALEHSFNAFKEAGAQIVDLDLIDPKYSIAVYTILQRSEVSSNLSRLDGIRYGYGREKFGWEAKKRIMLGSYTLSSGYYDEYYAKAQKVRTMLIDDFKEAFKKVDIIIGPTMPCVAMTLGDSERFAMFGELMDVLMEQSSLAGICGISVNCGFSEGLPVGMNIMAPHFEEAKILGAAHAFQQVTNFHKEIYKLDL